MVSALLCACSEDDDDFGGPLPPAPGQVTARGTLVFDWSIEGRKDAEACEEAGAALFQAIVVDEGFIIDDVNVPCEDFETRIELYPASFLTRSSLVDERGVPALGRIIEDLFLVEEGRVTRLVMDFPREAVPLDPAPDAGAPVPLDAGTPSDAGATGEEPPPAGETADAGAPDAEAPDAAAAP